MKAMKITIGSLIAAAIIILVFTLFVKNELADMLNPFIPQKDVFVKIDDTEKMINKSKFEYTLEGINEDGKKAEVTFTASKPLRKGAYLKIDTKRTYVKSWEEVQMKDMPSVVQKKL